MFHQPVGSFRLQRHPWRQTVEPKATLIAVCGTASTTASPARDPRPDGGIIDRRHTPRSDTAWRLSCRTCHRTSPETLLNRKPGPMLATMTNSHVGRENFFSFPQRILAQHAGVVESATARHHGASAAFHIEDRDGGNRIAGRLLPGSIASKRRAMAATRDRGASRTSTSAGLLPFPIMGTRTG